MLDHVDQALRQHLWGGNEGMTLVSIQPGYLSIARAAQYASVSTKTVKRWIKGGLAVHQGTARGKVLIRPVDIDAYLTRKQAPQLDLDALVDGVMRDLSLGPKAA